MRSYCFQIMFSIFKMIKMSAVMVPNIQHIPKHVKSSSFPSKLAVSRWKMFDPARRMSSWAPTMLTEMKRMRTGCRFEDAHRLVGLRLVILIS